MALLGNIFSLAGCAIMVLIGFVKKKERVISLQCFQFGFLAVGNLLLGAVSGFISGVVSVIRNLVFPRCRHPRVAQLLFIALQLVLTLLAGWDGPLSLLPFLAGVFFTLALSVQSDIRLKVYIIAAQILWAFYDWNYRNYVSFTFDILTILSNLSGILLLKRAAKEENN